MNHQIHRNINVGDTSAGCRHTLCSQRTNLGSVGEQLVHLFDGGVKLFDMADQQRCVMVSGSFNQLAAFFFGCGQRFFNQAVNAAV